jgi:radical SAM-linked protein
MTDPNQPERYRLRLVFAKKAQIKYISHLDLAQAWERALRRANIPLAYSQGFNPRPKIQFASGLPLGATGSAEILDVVMTQPLEPPQAAAMIAPKLPPGIGLVSIEAVPTKSPTLQILLHQAEYRVTVETDLAEAELRQRLDHLLAAPEIIHTRQRKQQPEQFDLRPWLHELRLESLGGGDAVLHMRLTTGQHGNLRPETVLEALGLAGNWADIERTRLIFLDEPPPVP